MTILDSFKYWLSKKGVNSEADNIADAIKEMADNDNGGSGGAIYDLDVKDAHFVKDSNIYFINPELYQAIISGNVPVVDCWDRSQRNADAWYHYNINTVLVYDKSLVEFCGTTDSEDYSTCYFKVFPSIAEFEEYMD